MVRQPSRRHADASQSHSLSCQVACGTNLQPRIRDGVTVSVTLVSRDTFVSRDTMLHRGPSGRPGLPIDISHCHRSIVIAPHFAWGRLHSMDDSLLRDTAVYSTRIRARLASLSLASASLSATRLCRLGQRKHSQRKCECPAVVTDEAEPLGPGACKCAQIFHAAPRLSNSQPPLL